MNARAHPRATPRRVGRRFEDKKAGTLGRPQALRAIVGEQCPVGQRGLENWKPTIVATDYRHIGPARSDGAGPCQQGIETRAKPGGNGKHRSLNAESDRDLTTSNIMGRVGEVNRVNEIGSMLEKRLVKSDAGFETAKHRPTDQSGSPRMGQGFEVGITQRQDRGAAGVLTDPIHLAFPARSAGEEVSIGKIGNVGRGRRQASSTRFGKHFETSAVWVQNANARDNHWHHDADTAHDRTTTAALTPPNPDDVLSTTPTGWRATPRVRRTRDGRFGARAPALPVGGMNPSRTASTLAMVSTAPTPPKVWPVTGRRLTTGKARSRSRHRSAITTASMASM